MAVKKYIAESSMYAWAMVRILLGYIFLWAFLDKLLGLGFSTCRDKLTDTISVGCSQSWLHGGSPTTGFLGHAASGPFANFYHHLAGQAWVDWLFMLGLLTIGLGLMLGIYVRFAAFTGIVMLVLMWSALLWPANAPAVDEHIIYAFTLFGVALVDEHQVWGMRSWWHKTSIVKTLPFLR